MSEPDSGSRPGTTAELLPCPFCGCGAAIKQLDTREMPLDMAEALWVECSRCAATSAHEEYDDSDPNNDDITNRTGAENLVEAAWNRRVSSPLGEPAIVRLSEHLRLHCNGNCGFENSHPKDASLGEPAPELREALITLILKSRPPFALSDQDVRAIADAILAEFSVRPLGEPKGSLAAAQAAYLENASGVGEPAQPTSELTLESSLLGLLEHWNRMERQPIGLNRRQSLAGFLAYHLQPARLRASALRGASGSSLSDPPREPSEEADIEKISDLIWARMPTIEAANAKDCELAAQDVLEWFYGQGERLAASGRSSPPANHCEHGEPLGGACQECIYGPRTALGAPGAATPPEPTKCTCGWKKGGNESKRITDPHCPLHGVLRVVSGAGKPDTP